MGTSFVKKLPLVVPRLASHLIPATSPVGQISSVPQLVFVSLVRTVLYLCYSSTCSFSVACSETSDCLAVIGSPTCKELVLFGPLTCQPAQACSSPCREQEYCAFDDLCLSPGYIHKSQFNSFNDNIQSHVFQILTVNLILMHQYARRQWEVAVKPVRAPPPAPSSALVSSSAVLTISAKMVLL